jgi:serine/threonine-protein kinase
VPDSARWARLNDLFHAAVAKPPPERASFLSAQCGGDAILRAEVESLLAAHREEQTGIRPAAVPVGSRLGDYEVTGFIAEGGMGQVYRARDARLGRDVAIKILPPIFTSDPERQARFEREARTLASLNHPHIGAIYGVVEAEGVQALVLELVEGDTLADRVQRGPVPVAEALIISRQIADALDAAHEKGIIHRDLKPANIKFTLDGVVKVLDFGLAKAATVDGATPHLTQSPVHGTRDGIILGTAAYMSPEQARGLAVDKRTDIWAFGCVLFEILSGHVAFAGQTVSDTIAVILEREPDWSRLPASTPANIHRLLQRCLQKDARRRLRDIGDARIELDDAWSGVGRAGSAVAPATREALAAHGRRWRAAGVIALAVLAGVGGWFLADRPIAGTPAAVVRLSIPSLEPPFRGPNGVRHLAISEDGSRVAYASATGLSIREMGRREAVAIAGADASNPFFSPNGEWVGFFGRAGGETGLKKVPALGGTPVSIVATSQRPGGGTWRADGTIVFATSEGLFQVSENGGEARLLVKPDPRRHERGYAWPQFTPDGRSVLFTIVPDDSIEGAQIASLDLKTLEARIVLKGGSAARYTSTGHLVYASGQTLKAIAFDADTQQTRGDPVSLPDIEIATSPDNGAAEFAVSGTGTLLFIAPSVPGQLLRTMSWVDRHGKEEPLALAPGRYEYARISPDGTRVALDIPGVNRDISIWNLQRRNLTKLTDGPTEDLLPLWSRDGLRVFFASNRTGNFELYSQAADGATMERLEYAGPGVQFPVSFTPDGTRLLVTENFNELSILNLRRPDRLEPLLHGEFNVWMGAVSPDGNWIAYESDESRDRTEIFLRPFPDVSGRREKVSIEGGRYPVWGPKGSRELFYVDLNGGMMAASVELSPSLSLGRVTKLFDWERPPRGVSGMLYDISPVDGRFLMIKPAQAGSDDVIDISVVLNWLEELKRLVPTK